MAILRENRALDKFYQEKCSADQHRDSNDRGDIEKAVWPGRLRHRVSQSIRWKHLKRIIFRRFFQTEASRRPDSSLSSVLIGRSSVKNPTCESFACKQKRDGAGAPSRLFSSRIFQTWCNR
jgi:hypothetical protein